jgi:hypothetical protein
VVAQLLRRVVIKRSDLHILNGPVPILVQRLVGELDREPNVASKSSLEDLDQLIGPRAV